MPPTTDALALFLEERLLDGRLGAAAGAHAEGHVYDNCRSYQDFDVVICTVLAAKC